MVLLSIFVVVYFVMSLATYCLDSYISISALYNSIVLYFAVKN